MASEFGVQVNFYRPEWKDEDFRHNLRKCQMKFGL